MRFHGIVVEKTRTLPEAASPSLLSCAKLKGPGREERTVRRRSFRTFKASDCRVPLSMMTISALGWVDRVALSSRVR